VTSTINVAAYSDALVVLGTAGILVPIVSRLGFSPVLGYLAAGALLGPFGLGSLIQSFPVLYWFTVGDAKDVTGIAELGVVFLLFLIGLELSLRRLTTMRRLVFGLGGLQILCHDSAACRLRGLFRQKCIGSDRSCRQPVAVVDRHRA
jgi:monovalent cation:H+ antiporter-2, CPA2 family